MSDAVLRFVGQDAGLDTQFRKAASSLTSLEQSAAKASSAISVGFKAAAGVVAAVGLSRIVADALQLADALEKSSARTGISVEALQKLQFVAAETSVDMETITGAINKFQVNLVEGGGKATAALDKLGISITDIRELKPDEQFGKIAEGIAAIDDPAQRTAAAVALFGKSGAELLPTLVEVGLNLKEAEIRLDAIGGPVSANAIHRVDELGDRMGDLKIAARNLGVELLDKLAPALTWIAEKAAETIGGLRLINGIGADELVNLDTQIRDLKERRDSILSGSTRLPGPARDQALDAIGKQLDELSAKYDRLTGLGVEGAKAFSEKNKALFDSLQIFTPTVKQLATPDFDLPQARRENSLAKDNDPVQIATLESEQLQQINQEKLDALLEQETAHVSGIQLLDSNLTLFKQALGVQEISFEQFKNASIGEAAIGLSGLLIDTAGKVFGESKALGIAQALVWTYLSVTNALANVPYPLNLVAAASVLVQGLSAVQKIRSTHKGGGGGGGGFSGSASSVSGGGSAAGSAAASAPTQAQLKDEADSKKALNVTVNGVITESAVREIFDLAGTMAGKGYVFINGRSTQAALIREGG